MFFSHIIYTENVPRVETINLYFSLMQKKAHQFKP